MSVPAWRHQGRDFGPTELVACPVCGVHRHSEVIRRPDGLPVVECAGCGLYFVNPQPTQEALVRFYASGYFEGGHDFLHGSDYFLQRDAGIRKGNVTGWSNVGALGVSGMSVLDLGCASGALLVLARQHGARRVKGIEIDERIAGKGRQKYGLDISVGNVYDVLGSESERFDVVSAFDLIEHVKEPRRLFEAVARVLAKGGRFVCSVPNGECLDLWRADWIGLAENMEHLCYFKPRDVHRLAALTDLKVDRIVDRGLPLKLKSYSTAVAADSRIMRLVREPAVVLSNAGTKLRAMVKGRAAGHELAIVLSPARGG